MKKGEKNLPKKGNGLAMGKNHDFRYVNVAISSTISKKRRHVTGNREIVK